MQSHCHSLNLLFCDVFAAVAVCIRSLPAWAIKSHRVDVSVLCLLYICDLNLEVIEKIQANKTVRLIVFHNGKVCTIRSQKFPEIHTGIFGRMESAPEFLYASRIPEANMNGL